MAGSERLLAWRRNLLVWCRPRPRRCRLRSIGAVPVALAAVPSGARLLLAAPQIGPQRLGETLLALLVKVVFVLRHYTIKQRPRRAAIALTSEDPGAHSRPSAPLVANGDAAVAQW